MDCYDLFHKNEYLYFAHMGYLVKYFSRNTYPYRLVLTNIFLSYGDQIFVWVTILHPMLRHCELTLLLMELVVRE